MTFSDIVNGAQRTFGTQPVQTAQPRFLGMSGTGAGMTLGGAVALYAIGRYFGVIPKLI